MKAFVFTFYYSNKVISICIDANNLYSALQKLYENCGSLFSNKNIIDMEIRVNGKRALKRFVDK